MPNPKQDELTASKQTDQQAPSQPAQSERPELECDKSEADVGNYMANLGAGTGVDIGPGAAGEMGGAAQEPNQQKAAVNRSQGDEAEYPDSGDIPHLKGAS